MKRIVFLTLVAILILALVSPVLALNEQPKFSRENYIYAKAEWTFGDPHEEGPFSYISFEIGRNKTFQDQFVLHLEITDYDGTILSTKNYSANIPESEFVFPKKLDSGIALNLHTQGTEYFRFSLMDEFGNLTPIDSGEKSADYAFDLTWTRDNHAVSFVNNHFSLNWGEEPADLIDLVYKSKEEHVSGMVSGTINQLELSEGYGEYGIKIDKTPVLYSESAAAAVDEAADSTASGSEEVFRFNEFLDISHIGGHWYFPIEDDPHSGSTLSLSIGMHDKKEKTYSLNIFEEILNDDHEVIGERSFYAVIPDNAFDFPKESPGRIDLDVHVCGTQEDYLFDEQEPIVTAGVEHDIQATWLLTTTQTTKAINKYADDYSKSMDIQRTTDYQGTVCMELDGTTFDSGEAWGGLWTIHTIYRSSNLY